MAVGMLIGGEEMHATVPKGGLEKRETLVEAAIREAWEEGASKTFDSCTRIYG